MKSNQRHVDRRSSVERQAKVLEIVLNSPAPITEKEILEKLRTRYTKRQVDSAIVSLRRYGRIEVAVPANGGHSSNLYVASAQRRTA